jgi:hypothetical protein
MQLSLDTLHDGQLHKAVMTERLAGALHLFDAWRERHVTPTCTTHMTVVTARRTHCQQWYEHCISAHKSNVTLQVPVRIRPGPPGHLDYAYYGCLVTLGYGWAKSC